jgi:hypothetical protein
MENVHPKDYYQQLDEAMERSGFNVNGPPKANDSQGRFEALLALTKSTHDAKGNDYASNGRPYENLRAGEEWGVEGWQYAMLRADEKMRRLKNFARTGSLKCESVFDSLIDIAVLSLIAYILLEDVSSNAVQSAPTPLGEEVIYASGTGVGFSNCGSSVFSLRNGWRRDAVDKECGGR